MCKGRLCPVREQPDQPQLHHVCQTFVRGGCQRCSPLPAMDELKRDCQRLGKRAWRDGQSRASCSDGEVQHGTPGLRFPTALWSQLPGTVLVRDTGRWCACRTSMVSPLAVRKVLQVRRSSTHLTPRTPVTGNRLCGWSTPQHSNQVVTGGQWISDRRISAGTGIPTEQASSAGPIS